MATVSWDQGRTKTLTIASSGTESDVLDMGSLGLLTAYRLGILAAAAFTGVITIEVSDSATGTFRTLQSDAADVTLVAGKATVLDPFPFPYMKIVSTLAEAASRDIFVIACTGGIYK